MRASVSFPTHNSGGVLKAIQPHTSAPVPTSGSLPATIPTYDDSSPAKSAAPAGSRAQVEKEAATLIQISSKDRVYLLGVVTLLPALADRDWDQLIDNFFLNDTVRILGYGLGSDYSVLEAVHPRFSGLVGRSAQNWLDLCQLVAR